MYIIYLKQNCCFFKLKSKLVFVCSDLKNLKSAYRVIYIFTNCYLKPQIIDRSPTYGSIFSWSKSRRTRHTRIGPVRILLQVLIMTI